MSYKPSLYYVSGTKSLFSWLPTPPLGDPGTPLYYGTHGIKELLDSTTYGSDGVKKYVDYFDIQYPATAMEGPSSENTGITNLVETIKARSGPFFLCGISQGAYVISQVYKKIYLPSGELYDRRNDFLGGFAYGNPLREAGHTFPACPDPGGHGCSSADQRLVGSEAKWWEFAAIAPTGPDIIAICGDDVEGSLTQAIYDWVLNDWSGLWDEMVAAAQAAFSEDDPTLVADLTSAIRDSYFWIDAHLSYVTWQPLAGSGDHRGSVQVGVDEMMRLAKAIPPFTPPPPNTQPGPQYAVIDNDRFRFIVEEARTGKILANDLEVQKPKILRALSGPCNIQFDVDYRSYANAGIYFKPWGHLIHVEKMIQGEKRIWASGLVQPSEIDKKTGIMHLEAKGFSGYAKGMPWLENWNPLAVDPFEIVHRVWDHLQSYPDGNLGVTVYPATSGLEMLPGYAFDGELLNLDFFAVFIRSSDKNDCGDYIDKLARDIPFDYVEQSAWNADKSGIDKKLYLGYPIAGVQQDNLAFVINENVIQVSPHIETQIDWASEVVIDGWFPGTEVSAQLSNSDPLRFRRVVTEDDARINSDERAAAWARRKLTRRQTPAHFDSIIVDMGHPNAPLGTYDVGDRIWVKGLMPWVGNINLLHKVLAIAVDEETGNCELTLRAEGSYEYDPIYYQGSVSGSLTMTVPDMPTPVITMDAPTLG